LLVGLSLLSLMADRVEGLEPDGTARRYPIAPLRLFRPPARRCRDDLDDGWSGENGLPALIRLDLSLVQGQVPDRITLYFAPRFANGRS